MSERQESPYDSIARSWLTLVERRQRNFIELCNTGRWRHYYTDAQFLDEMRKVLHLRNQWAQLAGLPLSGQIGLQQNLKQNDRHSQKCQHTRGKAVVAQRGWQRRRPASAILAAVAERL